MSTDTSRTPRLEGNDAQPETVRLHNACLSSMPFEDDADFTDAWRGLIAKPSVESVKRADGKLVHQIAGDPPVAGAAVNGLIDWDRRYLLMRTHTALHILCGVVWRDYGALVTGGDMKPGEGRMDFEFENFSAEFVDELEIKVNVEVAAERDIHVNNLTRAEADQVPDLIRTKINLLPPNIQEIRTIDIHGLDLQADGGTHVANTREVGVIKVVGHESKGRVNKRIRIALED